MARHRISITLPEPCLEWLDRQVEARIYANRSHGLEVLILEKMRNKNSPKLK